MHDTLTITGGLVAALLLCGSVPVRAQPLEGTLKQVKERGVFTIGNRESGIAPVW